MFEKKQLLRLIYRSVLFAQPQVIPEIDRHSFHAHRAHLCAPSSPRPLDNDLFTNIAKHAQDAFHKLREQIIICHQQPREHRGGLNMINNTNLEFFNDKQKAELFRLKGSFLTSLGAKQEANNAYSHAVQVRNWTNERISALGSVFLG